MAGDKRARARVHMEVERAFYEKAACAPFLLNQVEAPAACAKEDNFHKIHRLMKIAKSMREKIASGIAQPLFCPSASLPGGRSGIPDSRRTGSSATAMIALFSDFACAPWRDAETVSVQLPACSGVNESSIVDSDAMRAVVAVSMPHAMNDISTSAG